MKDLGGEGYENGAKYTRGMSRRQEGSHGESTKQFQYRDHFVKQLLFARGLYIIRCNISAFIKFYRLCHYHVIIHISN